MMGGWFRGAWPIGGSTDVVDITDDMGGQFRVTWQVVGVADEMGGWFRAMWRVGGVADDVCGWF